jgi:hypothetical protein
MSQRRVLNKITHRSLLLNACLLCRRRRRHPSTEKESPQVTPNETVVPPVVRFVEEEPRRLTVPSIMRVVEEEPRRPTFMKRLARHNIPKKSGRPEEPPPFERNATIIEEV